jgi:hypothetical protein
MAKIITLTQAILQKIAIKDNGDVFVIYNLADAQGEVFQTKTVKFLYEDTDPPSGEPFLSNPEKSAVNLLKNKITDHLEDLLEE